MYYIGVQTLISGSGTFSTARGDKTRVWSDAKCVCGLSAVHTAPLSLHSVVCLFSLLSLLLLLLLLLVATDGAE